MVTPQPLKGSSIQAQPSVNHLIFQINNERDFDDYILKHAAKAPLVKSELQYLKHPTQAPAQSQPTPPAASSGTRHTSMQMQSQPPPVFSLPQLQPDTHAQPTSNPDPSQQTGYTPYAPPSQQQFSQMQAPQHPSASYSAAPQHQLLQNDYPRGPAGQATAQQSSGVLYNNSQPPVNPVFGITLEDLFRRDGSPVPMVVYQCIQAVDLFGLEVEGIYRIPGTSSHIQQMKGLFDSGMTAKSHQILHVH